MSFIPGEATNDGGGFSSGGGGVARIIAGDSSITVSPPLGTGEVTLTVPPVIFPPSGLVSGMIMMWSSPLNPPPGWLICNGQPNTPDLRDKFIIGVGTIPLLLPGGSASITLTEANLPAHSHTLTNGTATASGGFTTYPSGAVGGTGIVNNSNVFGPSPSSTGVGVSIGGETDETGSGTPINILPPYTALYYIIYRPGV
jgi:microcystin-dependent protein